MNYTPIEPSSCLISGWPCLTQGEWVALWSGIIGAAAAFSLSILYQYLHRRNQGASARRVVQQAIIQLREAFRSTRREMDAEVASKAVVLARSTFSWAIGHPEHFSFEVWAKIHEMNEIIEIWFEDNSRLGGFRNSVYMGQGSPKDLWALGRRLDHFLSIEI